MKNIVDQYQEIVETHSKIFTEYSTEYQQRTAQGHSSYLLPFIQTFVEQVQGRRILDMGCGPGRDLVFFRDHGFEGIGIDCSPGMINLCQQQQLNVICTDFLSLPFKNHSFDGIWAYTSLTLVPQEILKQILEKISQLLEPKQGVFALGMIEGAYEGWKRDDKYGGSPRFIARYSENDLRKILISYFELVKVEIVPDPKNLGRRYLHCICKQPKTTAHHRLSNHILINGELVLSEGELKYPVVYPATLEVVGKLSEATQFEIDSAINNAHEAQTKWAKISPQERGHILRQCCQKLTEFREELAYLLTLESGKPLRTESRGEASSFIQILEFYSGLGTEIKGETAQLNRTTLMYTLREPIGVVAAILAWNVPLALMAYKVGPSLVAGNSVIIKPAEQASLAVLRAAEIMQTYLPPGVLNVITGTGEITGKAIVQHPLINKVTFTGSVETGCLVYTQAAQRLIPVSLELGGKSPMIICQDADIKEAVEQTLIAMRFTRQGQSCTATSRIFVHESCFDEFFKRLKERINELVIGDPFDLATDIGTVISLEQLEKIERYLNLARQEPGAQITYCCDLPQDEKFSRGWFIRPALITGISHDHAIAQEEIFGPVACLFTWNDLNSVLKMASDTKYGLAATIWTQNLNTAYYLVDNLKVGLVQINQHLPVQPGVSFGGYKCSGLGKEASLEAMIDHFTQKKTVLLKKPE